MFIYRHFIILQKDSIKKSLIKVSVLLTESCDEKEDIWSLTFQHKECCRENTISNT